MTYLRLPSDSVVQAFTGAFNRTFHLLLYVTGYALLLITLLSIVTPKETVIRAMLDGTIIQPLGLLALLVVSISAASGLVRAALVAFRARATLTVFRAARFKY